MIVTARSAHYRDARRLLWPFGRVRHTDHYNLLTLEVEDMETFLEGLRARLLQAPGSSVHLSRVLPVTHTFTVTSAADFETQARAVVLGWAGRVAGRTFHVRVHRRGLKGQLHSKDVERHLSEALLEASEREGTLARVTFDDPDVIVDVELLGHRAGCGLWTRHDRERYVFLRLD